MKVYGEQIGGFRCTNSEAGSFNHECGKPATWIGTKPSRLTAGEQFSAAFCDHCKAHGWEAKGVHTWERIGSNKTADDYAADRFLMAESLCTKEGGI